MAFERLKIGFIPVKPDSEKEHAIFQPVGKKNSKV